MKNLMIIGVTVEEKDVVVSLYGGPDNVAGTLRFFEKDDLKRQSLRHQAEELMNGNVLVDLAISSLTWRWRLLGRNHTVVGGLEPTKLELSQSGKTGWGPKTKRIDEGGLGWPEAWGEDA